MKEIKAYIRRAMRDNVIAALERVEGMKGFAVVPVAEFGHEVQTGKLNRIDMVKIEIDVPDHVADPVVDCIVKNGRTGSGHAGDGSVVVLDIHDAVRIADGTRGDAGVS